MNLNTGGMQVLQQLGDRNLLSQGHFGPSSSRLSGPLVPKFARRGGPGPPRTPSIHPGKNQPGADEKFSGTWPFVGATVPLAVGRQDRPAPSMSRGISAAHHRRWAAYAMSLGFRVLGSGFRV